MTSPINNLNRSGTESLSNKSSATRSKVSDIDDASRGAEASENAADTVSLSSQSTQVMELQSRLGEVPEIDAEKVASIKKEIANGNYPVDSQAIAENMIKLEKALTE